MPGPLRRVSPPEQLPGAAALIERGQTRLGSHGLSHSTNDPELDDALQELWLCVICRPPEIEVAVDENRLVAWLIGALRHLQVDEVRRLQRSRRTLQALYQLHRDVHDEDASADLERSELADEVQRVLSRLEQQESATNFRLFRARLLDDRSLAEIATELGLSVAEASARLQRTKKKFRLLWLRNSGGGGKND